MTSAGEENVKARWHNLCSAHDKVEVVYFIRPHFFANQARTNSTFQFAINYGLLMRKQCAKEEEVEKEHVEENFKTQTTKHNNE